jgi:hypothetical protein
MSFSLQNPSGLIGVKKREKAGPDERKNSILLI